MAKKSKFSSGIWLYISIICIIVLTVFVFGIAGPYLVSASDFFLVSVGFVLLIFYPILVAIWVKNFVLPQFKKVTR